MTTPSNPPTPGRGTGETKVQDSGVRNYTFLCLVALVVLFLVLLLKLPDDFQLWGLVPIIVGLVCLLLRWSWGPFLFLLTLALLFWFTTLVRWTQVADDPLTDLALCAAVLAYVAGHYRLQGLLWTIRPQDPRRPTEPAPPVAGRPGWHPVAVTPARRSPRLVSAAELVLLLVALPSWAGLALICLLAFGLREPAWQTFGESPSERFFYPHELLFLEIVDLLWRCRLLLWVLGGGVLAASALLRYLAWWRLTPAEATLFLQDTAWVETRREQRRINSWLIWDRLRRRRRKDKV